MLRENDTRSDLLELPEGYTSRPPVMDDIPAVVELINQCSEEMIGAADTTVEGMQNNWSSPGLNPETDLRVVFSPAGETAGYLELWATRDIPVYPFAWGRVHPEHTELGIGTSLLTWAEERARQVFEKVPPKARVAMRTHLPSGHQPSDKLLSGYGMELIRHSFQMQIDLTESPPAPEWPKGISVRTYRPEDIEAVYRADEEAFEDHFGYIPQDFETGFERFKHFLLNDKGFDPELWFLAMDGDEIAGFSLCRRTSQENDSIGWVRSLGVRRPWRQRGLGLALLRHSFGEFYQRGKAGVGLGVDAENLTGALNLYKKAGMHVHRQYNLYEKEIRPGKDISTH